jgi:cytochrome c oxidase subunit 2
MKKILNFRKKLGSLSAFAAAMLATMPAFATLGQPDPNAIGLQSSASPRTDRMIEFHNHLLMPIITGISLFVLALLLIVIVRFNAKANPVPSKTTHNTMLEVVWTLIPVLILVVVAIPSMKMLYYVDRTTEAEMTLKIIGNQWYWNYEYPDNGGISFASNIVKDKAGNFAGNPRLLEVDNPVHLPVNTKIKILTAANDVIHSWAVPAFAVKMDAVPGRINETWIEINQPGTFYGQCSQLCGQNHAYMPIEVIAESKEDFAKWVHSQGGKMPAEIAADKAAKSAADAKAAADAAAKAAKAPAAKKGTAPANAKAPQDDKNKKTGEK